MTSALLILILTPQRCRWAVYARGVSRLLGYGWLDRQEKAGQLQAFSPQGGVLEQLPLPPHAQGVHLQADETRLHLLLSWLTQFPWRMEVILHQLAQVLHPQAEEQEETTSAPFPVFALTSHWFSRPLPSPPLSQAQQAAYLYTHLLRQLIPGMPQYAIACDRLEPLILHAICQKMLHLAPELLHVHSLLIHWGEEACVASLQQASWHLHPLLSQPTDAHLNPLLACLREIQKEQAPQALILSGDHLTQDAARRQRLLQLCPWQGVTLNPVANKRHFTRISTLESTLPVLLLPADASQSMLESFLTATLRQDDN